MHGVFITGTDTGVGKTVVGCRLITALRRHGLRVRPRKPVESGCAQEPDGLHPLDAEALRQAAGGLEPLAHICPYRLRHALSPERAARLEGVALPMEGLVNACRTGVDGGLVLVEGAGGFYSPLAQDGLNADLAGQLALPVLVVAPDRLGVINHVLLTLEAIERRDLVPLGVVLSQVEAPGDEPMDNGADLRRRVAVPVDTLGHLASGRDEPTGLEQLAARMAAAGYTGR